MIRVENLSKSFGNLTVLHDVSLHIKKGECVAIIGPSGTGKSVFLSCLNGLMTPDCGKIFVDGENICDKHTNINKVRSRMGMVYQAFHLFSHLTVMENITLAPRKLTGLSDEAARTKAEELLDMVALRDKANAMPDELSGGQKQRIAIARAMAMDPQLVLFDEPTSALDPAMVGEVLASIRTFADKGVTMVIVTHEMEFAREVATRVLYMDEKGIYEDGTPEKIFDAPEKPKTKAFIRKLKTLRYEINSRNFDFLQLYTQISLFCQKYRISPKASHSMQLCTEEAVFYLLNNNLAAHIELSLEYSDKDGSVILSLDYDGLHGDPFEGKEDIGIMLLRAKSSQIQYSNDKDGNHLKLNLKTGGY
ncbi:MAG: amino acid ABC transporter ATP-binding protein [Firmicutes bacterium]|nr:amino acid ABC transporter ATP-binding protein [Bacillota bacterium]